MVGFFVAMSEMNEAIKKGEYLTQAIFKTREDRTTIVFAHDLRQYYKYNYNPAKGETADGELERWLKFLKNVHNIASKYELSNDEYHFRKMPCEHKDIESEFMGGGFLYTCCDCGKIITS